MQKLIKFLKEVAAEFKNITWPQKDTLIQLTFVIISVSIIISALLGGLDYIFVNSIGLLGNSLPAQNTIQTDTSTEPQQDAIPTQLPEILVSPTPISKK